ncbi:hypothetical protein AN3500.2 [Aspergillus nidulans FGSC A4]|nr:hypothetical protein AN3500.2 [Aspergillus nidulans FGSC A4]|eukprot:XP_661104.1 hypothetical protein AN3500.2 [Aspergillus nidulans FGSC A4]
MEEESVALLLQQLQELRTEMRTQKQQLQEENNSLRAELQAVRNSQLRNHPPVTTTVTSATPTPYERSYPRPRHPDVEPFTGEDPKDYPPFQMNLRTKFAIDAACYPTEEEQVYYAYSRLRGKASQRVLPWLLARQKSETPVLWAEFSAVLDKAFGDPDRQRKALFLNEFDEELLNTGGINWDDNQKKALLDRFINVELLKAMVGIRQEDSYDNYCNQLREINHNLQRVARLTRKGSRAAVPTHVARTRPAGGSDRTGTPDQMDWEATHAQIAALQKEVAALLTSLSRYIKYATIPIHPKPFKGVTGNIEEINKIVRVQLDIGAHTEKGAYFYVIPDNLGYDLILGLPWLEQHDGRYPPQPWEDLYKGKGAVAKILRYLRSRLADIQKALAPKRHIDPRTKLPRQYWKYLRLFEQDKAEELPPHRGDGIDHKIELVQEESGKDPEVPWGPLYNNDPGRTNKRLYPREPFPSCSPSTLCTKTRRRTAVLRRSDRALNAITKKDRYPLPLIHETLNQIGQARWFTKLDVSAAFHKIRMSQRPGMDDCLPYEIRAL